MAAQRHLKKVPQDRERTAQIEPSESSTLLDFDALIPEPTPGRSRSASRTGTSEGTRRPNQFAGPCLRCGDRVSEGAGTIERDLSGVRARADRLDDEEDRDLVEQ